MNYKKITASSRAGVRSTKETASRLADYILTQSPQLSLFDLSSLQNVEKLVNA
jgi:hypothetical protein